MFILIPILIVLFFLDLFITIKITDNYKILCEGHWLWCADKSHHENKKTGESIGPFD